MSRGSESRGHVLRCLYNDACTQYSAFTSCGENLNSETALAVRPRFAFCRSWGMQGEVES